MRLFPDLDIPTVVTIYKNEGGMLAQDPKLPERLNAGLEIYKGLVENGRQPSFCPVGQVANETMYGYVLYQDFGLLSERDYTGLLGKSPKEGDAQPLSFPWQGPDQNQQQLYCIDLGEISPQAAQAMKKVRLQFGSSANRMDMYVTESTQLHEDQVARTFNHLTSKHFKSRDTVLKPTCDGPSTLSQLREMHDRIDTQKANAAKAAAAKGMASGDADEARRVGTSSITWTVTSKRLQRLT